MQNLIDADKQADLESLKKQVYVFLAITFGLTYTMNFIGMAVYGPIASGTAGSKWGILLGTQMLLPAVSAIISMFIFKDERLAHANKWFLGYFMLFFLVSLVFLFVDHSITMPSNNPAYGSSVEVGLSQIIPAILGMLGLILLLILNIKKSSREQLKTLSLSWGHHKINYLVFPLLYSLLLIINILLNYLFNLNNPALTSDITTFSTMLLAGIINGISTAWVYFFGEEFGWRIYLQDRLIPLWGIKKGVLLIGVIWGLWHAPVIALGYNYPGHPVTGVITMVLFCVTTGIIFSYAVFKTGSVWIAALLHLITNTVLPAAMFYLCMPNDILLSFGMGIYGIIFMGVFAFIIFKFGKWTQDHTVAFMQNPTKDSIIEKSEEVNQGEEDK
ncbi:MAG: hypothetical protein CVU90_03280 [Firmicutes bacterium HGW-Firmicutes-15]|nr:MAG: hypothetical protein CVU90_03280 [Firmicutes bacterium HGW-Firmicutes-15]